MKSLFATPWTVAHQAPPSMPFSRQEYWSGLPFPSPGDLPDPGIEPRSPALQANAFTYEPPGKNQTTAKTWWVKTILTIYLIGSTVWAWAQFISVSHGMIVMEQELKDTEWLYSHVWCLKRVATNAGDWFDMTLHIKVLRCFYLVIAFKEPESRSWQASVLVSYCCCIITINAMA